MNKNNDNEQKRSANRNNNSVLNKISLLAIAFALLKRSFLPFARSGKFVAEDILNTAKKDSIKMFMISMLALTMAVLSILIWISLGAGIIVYFLFPNALSAWLYLLLFELLTLLLLIVLIWLLKKSMRLPESIERAKKLFNLK